MANENKKNFNAMMKNNKDMPKIQIVEDENRQQKKQKVNMKSIELFKIRNIFLQWMNFIINTQKKVKFVIEISSSQMI